VETSRDAGLGLLGDPTRRTIFELLARHPCSAGALAQHLPINRPAVSQHLRVLLPHLEEPEEYLQALRGFVHDTERTPYTAVRSRKAPWPGLERVAWIPVDEGEHPAPGILGR
jgi:DNA-binding transcriptional ArsR family regulator